MGKNATSGRAERDQLRGQMRELGASVSQIAAEMARRYNLRPRRAWRDALGWTQSQLAMRYNEAHPGATLGDNRISEYEAWPGRGTKPPMSYLTNLAATFGHGCTVAELVDAADLAHLPVADRRHAALAAKSLRTDGGTRRMNAAMVQGRPQGPGTSATIPRLSLPVSGGSTGVLEAPAGRYFSGTTFPAYSVPAVDDGRIVATLPRPIPGHDPLDGRGRALVVATVASPGNDEPTLYGMDTRRARKWVTDPDGVNRLPFPRAYQLDDLTLGVMWAAANFDDSLLDDDGALEQALRSVHVYEELPRSTVTGASVDDLSPTSQMWLGSQFCADHIQRHSARLTDRPDFWTREQRGEEASAWLLFEHKLDYLRVYAGDHVGSPQRTFCIPPAMVTISPRPERILLFLVAALMESFTITVNVVTEPEYAAMPGFVTDNDQRAIVATWIGSESLWHVDVPDQRPQLREFSDALDFAQAHSVTAGSTSEERLQALARYLDLDWSWLASRCAQLGDYGAAGLIAPRSRLLSAEGVDRACRFVGAFAASDR